MCLESVSLCKAARGKDLPVLLFSYVFFCFKRDGSISIIVAFLLDEICLRLRIPQSVVLFAQLMQLCKERVLFAQLFKIVDGRQRHRSAGIDQLFPARDVGQVQRCFRSAVQAAHMGNHHRRVDLALGRHFQRFQQIVVVAAAGTYDVGGIVMHIVKCAVIVVE